MSETLFFILALIVIFIDVSIAVICIKKNEKSSIYLAYCSFCAGILVFCYLMSVVAGSYFGMSLASSFYFSFVDLMLVFFLHYVISFASAQKYINKKLYSIIMWVIRCYTIFDIAILLINPFKEIALTYAYHPYSLASWSYVPHILYIIHLSFCYSLICFSFVIYIVKMMLIPRVYRRRYISMLIWTCVMVFFNAIYIFLPVNKSFDYSILFYSVIDIVIYWNSFKYSERSMLNKSRQMILAELGHPVILFDYQDILVLANDDAKKIFTIIPEYLNDNKNLELKDFLKKYELENDNKDFSKDISFEWVYNGENESSIYRFDYHILKDKKNRIIGKLFVMTDNSLDIDLMTGFHTKNSFDLFFKDDRHYEDKDICVSICDLNRLSYINSIMGEKIGDKTIKTLASLMKKHLPENSYFARLNDANLVAVSPGYSQNEIRQRLINMRAELNSINKYSVFLDMVSSICMVSGDVNSVAKASKTAYFSMKAKKMMDSSSAHSSLLDSLAQTQLESDGETESHVKRTRDMGEKLGHKLGLSDIEQSNLALLCLLHDIGKVGIPLEILNKPTKLSKEEWDVMKSHVEKGYRIAKASPELEGIADFILHHHECWNGSGYPDGLEKDRIPLLSRVIAVVDTYDAMTNDRPYRRALDKADARKELISCAGTQFDPNIVAEFINLLDEIDPVDTNSTPIENEKKDDIKPMGIVEDLIKDTNEESSNIGLVKYAKYTLDAKFSIIDVNDEFIQLTGYTREEVESYNLNQLDLIFSEDKDIYLQKASGMLATEHEAYIEHRVRRKDGSARYVFCYGKEYFDSVSRLPRIIIVATDITETASMQIMLNKERDSVRRNIIKWEENISKDPLTGILNHVAFKNEVEGKLRSKEYIKVFLMMDLDNFKGYNDTYGHLMGDELLIHTSYAFSEAVKGQGFAGRMGGDEFSAFLMLDKSTSDKNIKARAKAIWHQVTIALSALDRNVTVSMGAAVEKDEAVSFNDFYNRADKALYTAKNKGKNGIFVGDLDL